MSPPMIRTLCFRKLRAKEGVEVRFITSIGRAVRRDDRCAGVVLR